MSRCPTDHANLRPSSHRLGYDYCPDCKKWFPQIKEQT